MFVSPTVVGDQVFVASCSGVFFALDRASGEVGWSYDTSRDAGPAQFHGNPIAVGELIVTGSDGADPSYVYAFQKKSGRLIWKRDVDAPETDLVALGERVVGRSWRGALIALETKSGEVAWRVADPGSRCGRRVHSPAVHNGVVYFPDNDGHLRSVDGKSGDTLWSQEVGCAAGTPLIWDGHLYQGLTSRSIVRLSLTQGRVSAQTKTDGLPHTRLTAAGDVLVALVGEKSLVAFAKDLSRPVWEVASDSAWSAFQPLVWKGWLVVGDAGGRLQALDPATGSVAWSTSVKGAVRGLGASQDMLYVGTLEGPVYALRIERPGAPTPSP